ncbi:MAG: hypothetical protein U0166_02985 [Acidobacteriota bacterium]
MPVLPYFEGAILSVLGFGLLEQRLMNAALSIVVLALVSTFRWRRGWSFVAGCVIALTPGWSYSSTTGKTFGIAQLFMTCALICALAGPSRIRVPGCALACFGAAGSRLLLLPVTILIGVVLAAPFKTFGRRVVVASLCIVPILAVLAAALLAWPERSQFWLFTYHGGRGASDRDVSGALLFAPAPLLLALVAIAAAFSARRWTAALVAGVGLVLLAIAQGFGPGFEPEYLTPFIAPVAMASVAILSGLPSIRQHAWTSTWLGLVLLPAVLFRLHPSLTGPDDATLHRDADATVAYLRANVPSGSAVLSPVPSIPLEAGLSLYPGSEIGPFAATDELAPEVAARVRLIARRTLIEEVGEQKIPCVVVFRILPEVGTGCSALSLRFPPGTTLRDVESAFSRLTSLSS